MKKNNQTKQRYAIRKFTVGTGSALIASLVFVGIGASAQADTTSTQSNTETKQTVQADPQPSLDSAVTKDKQDTSQQTNSVSENSNTSSEPKPTTAQPDLDPQFSHVPQASIQPKPEPVQPASTHENVPAQTPAPTLDKAFSHAKSIEDSATNDQEEQAKQQLPVQPAQQAAQADKTERNNTSAVSDQPALDPDFSHVNRNETKTLASQQATSSKTPITPAPVSTPSEKQEVKTKNDKLESQQVAQTVLEDAKAENNKTIDAPTLIPAHQTEQKVSQNTKDEAQAPVTTNVSDAPLNGDTTSKDKHQPDKSKEVKSAIPEATAPRSVQQPVSNQSETVSTKEKQTQSINKYPVIFVHGFMGFTGDMKPDLYPNYWGGDKYRVIDGLREKGYDAYEASVGAFSSNYDRAVELYYYIKGGTVDYGAAHAKKYGHARYGRTYTGVFHDWQPGQKVHLVGHSMGGQTIRLLEHFLRFGSQEEIDNQRQNGGTISPLFEGGKDNMIASITTLGTPHNGSAAADRVGNEKAFKDIIYALGRMGGGKLSNIDFGFEKWGFKQGENESYIDYANRVAKSNLWNTDDNAMYDLTSEGSEKLNQMTPMNPNIVYTTYTGLASHEGLTGNYVPDLGQYFLFDTTSRIIGSEPDQSLRPNDGIVSVVSSLYPTGQAFTDFTDGLKKGVWQVTPVMKGWDHLDLVGLDALDFKHTGQELQGFYAGLINNMMRVEELEA